MIAPNDWAIAPWRRSATDMTREIRLRCKVGGVPIYSLGRIDARELVAMIPETRMTELAFDTLLGALGSLVDGVIRVNTCEACGSLDTVLWPEERWLACPRCEATYELEPYVMRRSVEPPR
jgi:hypothetical protein